MGIVGRLLVLLVNRVKMTSWVLKQINVDVNCHGETVISVPAVVETEVHKCRLKL